MTATTAGAVLVCGLCGATAVAVRSLPGRHCPDPAHTFYSLAAPGEQRSAAVRRSRPEEDAVTVEEWACRVPVRRCVVCGWPAMPTWDGGLECGEDPAHALLDPAACGNGLPCPDHRRQA